MTDEVIFDAPVEPKAKSKPARKARKARAAKAAPPEKSSVPFPGLTRTNCADACNAKGCAISGSNYCAHPTKGGLQAVDRGNPTKLKRMQDARDQLDVRLDPDRFK